MQALQSFKSYDNPRQISNTLQITLIHSLYDAKIFTPIGVIRAHEQIPVQEADLPKTAITTPFRLYEFPHMTFGLRNAAQTFQRFINTVLSGLDFLFSYMDDVLIASTDEDAHKNI
ncbi:gag-pol polyprotein [Nephila pilipes]|uniref:Gag-pol polyprotein n=1 Tax=Nephila pilipes TaxID=299642 RepID=A0A8X6PQD4_NEPPI|nr:gag-pol polyprotein [Nephila pilipes]